jgi:hypothetical protein
MKEQQDNKNKSETTAEASTKPYSNKKGAETPAEASTRSESSGKKTPPIIKAQNYNCKVETRKEE